MSAPKLTQASVKNAIAVGLTPTAMVVQPDGSLRLEFLSDQLCDKNLKWVVNQVDAGSSSKGTLTSRRTGLKQACEALDPDGERMGALDADPPEVALFTYKIVSEASRPPLTHA